jgi:SAM-dependent MidA family methyltransferase
MKNLQNLIQEEIKGKGPMSVTRFMELALYHPEWGYYAKHESIQKIGKKGDFITSVSAGPLFGRLLAQQIFDWWKGLGSPQSFQIVECGGLDGQLAFDILMAFEKFHSEIQGSLHYTLVEPLTNLQKAQEAKLHSSSPKVTWVKNLNELPPFEGVIFGNELIDAFPIHLLECCGKEWKEVCLTLKQEPNDATLLETTRECFHQNRSGSSLLPDGLSGQIEICPAADQWLHQASQILTRGYLLLLDYGLTDEEYFEINRPNGTIRGYRNHQSVENVFENPGEQDITYHVRWSPLIATALKEGLQQNEFIQQGRWLTRIVANHQLQLNPSEIRQFHTLTHPEMMGAPFRALVFKK